MLAFVKVYVAHPLSLFMFVIILAVKGCFPHDLLSKSFQLPLCLSDRRAFCLFSRFGEKVPVTLKRHFNYIITAHTPRRKLIYRHIPIHIPAVNGSLRISFCNLWSLLWCSLLFSFLSLFNTKAIHTLTVSSRSLASLLFYGCGAYDFLT